MSLLNNRTTDPNRILPMTYHWARQHYRDAIANTWTPEEIPMQDDIEQWKSTTLNPAERHLVLFNLGFFSTAESLTANNIVLAIYRHITNPECRQYLLRQAFEEAVHTDTFIYCCDSLGLDPDTVYGMYETVPSIKGKDEFVINLTGSIMDPHFQTDDSEGIRRFLRDLVGYYVIMEGIFFYAGFAMMLALKRNGLMRGVGEQFEYIMRDESLHLAFGCDLIMTIRTEHPEVWDAAFEDEVRSLIVEAVRLESEYARQACPLGVRGMSAEVFQRYVQHIADRRLERLSMPPAFGTENPLPWMSQSTDLAKEKNFFETRVTEYQRAANLSWD